MSRLSRSLFRGSEFPRLILLAAILMVGWPLVLLYARPLAEPEKPPPPPPTAESLTKVVPDTGLEFQALEDRKGMTSRDNPAYSILLERTRKTSAADLAKVSRRDIYFTHLWERPEKYRGVPVHLEGTVKKTLTYPINPVLAPSGQVCEVWFYSDENRKYPYALIVEEPPKGFPISPEVHLRASFDGYFLKLLRYDAGDSPRAAPLLVGRLHWAPDQASKSPLTEIRRFTQRDGFLIVIVLLLGYVGLRVLFGVRKALGPKRTSANPPRVIAEGEIAPEALAEWLQSVPAGDESNEKPA